MGHFTRAFRTYALRDCGRRRPIRSPWQSWPACFHLTHGDPVPTPDPHPFPRRGSLRSPSLTRITPPRWTAAGSKNQTKRTRPDSIIRLLLARPDQHHVYAARRPKPSYASPTADVIRCTLLSPRTASNTGRTLSHIKSVALISSALCSSPIAFSCISKPRRT